MNGTVDDGPVVRAVQVGIESFGWVYPGFPDAGFLWPWLLSGVLLAGLIALAGIRILRWGRRFDQAAEPFPTPEWRFPAKVAAVLLPVLVWRTFFEAPSMMEAPNLYFGEMRWWDVFKLNVSYQHFPLHNLLLKTMANCGGGLHAFRTISVLAHLASLLPFYEVTRRLFPGRAAKWATILFAASPMAMYYAGMVESYAIVRLLVVAVLWLLLVKEERPGTRITPLVAIIVAGSYTHQYFLLFLVAILAALLWKAPSAPHRRYARVIGWVLVLTSPLVIFELTTLPIVRQWAPSVLANRFHRPAWQSPWMDSVHDMVSISSFQVGMWNEEVIKPLGLVILGLVAAAGAHAARYCRIPWIVFSGWILAGVAFAFGVFYHYSFTEWMGGWYPLYRHNTILTPFVALAFGYLLHRAWQRALPGRVATVLLAIVAALQVASAGRSLVVHAHADVGPAWDLVRERIQDGDALANTPWVFPTLATIRPDSVPFGGNFWNNRWFYNPGKGWVQSIFNPVDVRPELMGNILAVRRVWDFRTAYKTLGLVPDTGDFGSENFDRKFSEWKVIEHHSFDNLELRLLQAPPAPKFDGEVLEIGFATNSLCYLQSAVRSLPERWLPYTVHPADRLVVPLGERLVPNRLDLVNGADVTSIGLSLPDVLPLDDNSMSLKIARFDFGYVIPIGLLAPGPLDSVRVRYGPGDEPEVCASSPR